MKSFGKAFTIFFFWFIRFGQGFTITYDYTGNYQTYTVPKNVTSLQITAVGGVGGSISSSCNPGFPAMVTSTISVSPGQNLYVYVGGNGNSNGLGGYNGGGAGASTGTYIGAGGGGASDIRTVIGSLSSRLVVAAGGGGSSVPYSGYSCYYGGSGSCVGYQGYPVSKSAPYGGFGGNLTAGGRGGYYSSNYPTGSSGSLGYGGAAASYTSGGGGGGGYFGGGGGSFTSGGGGSSHSVSSYSCSSSSYSTTAGSVTISYLQNYTVTLNYTGASQTLSLPSDVTTAQIVARGAQGGSIGASVGGLGGNVKGNIQVCSGSSLTVTVGGTNGYNGGGNGGTSSNCTAATGGGATSIGTCGYANILVVGGGGGAGFDPSCPSCVINGGAGGTAIGRQGSADPKVITSYGGYGGTTTSGGSGGYYNSKTLSGFSGSYLKGGAGAYETCGGGGGGGYYGGGGGSFTGGGGGSTYIYSSYYVSTEANTAGVQTGNGYVTITYSSIYGPNDNSSSNSESDVGGVVGFVIGVLVGICCLCCCCKAIIDQGKNGNFSRTNHGNYPLTNATWTPNPVRSTAVTRSGPTKIQVANQTMSSFLTNVMSTSDKCSVVGFSDTYKFLSTRGNEHYAKQSLNWCTSNCNGGTHLWDSIVMAVQQFIQTAERNVPWLLIVLTDGDDQGSSLSMNDAATVLSAFNKGAGNFTFVIGLGKNVSSYKLQSLCRGSNSFYLPAQEAAALDLIFAIIALQVFSGVQVDAARIVEEGGVEAAYVRVRELTAVRRISTELLLLVDISGSMNEQ